MIDEKENESSALAKRIDADSRLKSARSPSGLTIWLKSPEVFETWVKLRRASADFKSKFGEDLKLIMRRFYAPPEQFDDRR